MLEASSFEEIEALRNRPVSEQDIPFMGPPVLRELKSGRTLSQMPAIVLHASHELGLVPKGSFDVAICMKVLMDCNDVLMEICRYNGSTMWERADWIQFRSERFPHWLEIFEESLSRGHFGKEPVSFADIGVFALFGNMMRCLPELEPDVLANAPGVHAHCQRIGSKPSLAEYVAMESERYGQLYCGGYIEKSIRRMLEMDEEERRGN